jgi:DNA mismatch endonuclease (patch repair protein)
MRLVRSKDSKCELRVRSAVHQLGYRFRKHVLTLPGKPDMVFASRRSIIFINGCYWHGHKCRLARMPKSNSAYWTAKVQTNQARDTRHLDELNRAGWSVLTVWECQLSDFAALIASVRDFLGPPVRRKKKRHQVGMGYRLR